ncbi:hypothetical protein HMPREF9719_01201 [Corynebacterium otitidis ATCC 51513]|uniref:Putative membrane protein n=2 Tax=Corynebacterium otitidis TaxID=29321 RepID=I7KJM9_9CORY|nr:hypothetical protein HMPREF9719_01201 [Corynebacterium otitidis ATCC 51513]KKO83256.1 membrane protein [Corynebacterium otitidis]CCI83720.1 putative membrane protein [Corynebacterium otitidis ATCC 51513]
MTHHRTEPAADAPRAGDELSRMTPVSPKLAAVRLISTLPFEAIIAIGLAAAGWFVHWAFYIGTALAVVLLVWHAILIPLQVRHTAWLETDDELLITRGKLWHTFTVVPYGRIQFVDVTAGPLMRAFGLKTVSLNTASSTSDSSVPGLENDVADALRERLAEKARERMSGL